MLNTPVNITSPEFKANPFPFYAHLRKNQPVYQTHLGKQTIWMLTRYEDVAMVLKDERFVKERRNAMTPEQLKKQPWVPPMFKARERSMLEVDMPDHARLRGLVHKAFTPRLIEQMRERVQTLSEELLNKAIAKGQIDLVKDYALPLPVTVIAEMLGVPQKDQFRFAKWSNTMMTASSNPNPLRLIPTIMAFTGYLRKLFKQRRANPQDDLITALVQAEEAGDKLSEDELLSMCVLLLVAGHETSVNLIATGALALIQHPEQMAMLRDDPTLIKPAIEELTRFVCPVEHATERFTREDVALHGMVIPQGETIFAVIGSANRDEAHFDNPDSLNIQRENNKHLGFGLGMHYCLGAPLARLEGQIAINTLLRHLPDLQLAVPESKLRWRSSIIFRGLESLPVTF
jgi:cytochrome P450